LGARPLGLGPPSIDAPGYGQAGLWLGLEDLLRYPECTNYPYAQTHHTHIIEVPNLHGAPSMVIAYLNAATAFIDKTV